MSDDAPRKRGRPKDKETDPLAKLMAKMKGPRVRFDVGDGKVSRRVLGSKKKKAPQRAKIDKAQSPSRNSDVDAVIARLEAREARTRRNAANAKKPVTLAVPKVQFEKIVDPYSRKIEVKPTTGSHLRIAKKWQCEDGAHIEQFIRDFEMVGKDLSAASFDPSKGGGGGGKPTPFPERKIAAAERLAGLRSFLQPGQYDLVVAVCIYNIGVAKLHEKGGEQHIVAKREVKDALDAMGRFYTPGRMARKRTWEAATKILEELERIAK